MMKRWIFKPLESIGNIRFGMKREEVHSLLGNEFTEFKKNRFSKNTADDYKQFHIFYSTDNEMAAIEFFEDVEIILDGIVIFPICEDEIEKTIEGMVCEGAYYTHTDKSIGFEVEHGKATSILLGERGYYS